MLAAAHKVINKKARFVNNFLPPELFSVENEPIIHFYLKQAIDGIPRSFLQICISFVLSEPLVCC